MRRLSRGRSGTRLGDVDGHRSVGGWDVAEPNPLLILTEDVMPGDAFARHPHGNLGTVAAVLDGALEPFDSAGHVGGIEAGDARLRPGEPYTEIIMSYAIIGFGSIGQALAKAFARKSVAATVASRRSPDALTAQAAAIGPEISPKSLEEALNADTIFLAVPFAEHAQVAKLRPSWEGKTVIDVMNAYGIPVEDLDGQPSSAVVARAFAGAKLARAFNHLPAAKLAADPDVQGGRRVIFVSSDDAGAADAVAELADQLGYAPVKLGALAEGGSLVQARGTSWGPLIFQDLTKFAS